MTDKFISDATVAFQLGQTVIAKVTNLDEEKRRFLVTLKISEVISPEGDTQTRLINGLQERRAVTEMLAMRGKNVLSVSVIKTLASCKQLFRYFVEFILQLKSGLIVSNLSICLPLLSDNSDLRQQLAALFVGQKLKLTVDTVEDSGATFKSDDLAGATILASKHHVMGMFLTRNM